MQWLANFFQKYPEMAVYLAVGIGYFLGRLKFRGFGLGVVTSSLLAGILIGNLVRVPVADQAKAMLFLIVPVWDWLLRWAELLSQSQRGGLALGSACGLHTCCRT